jgi:hypothetical protein
MSTDPSNVLILKWKNDEYIPVDKKEENGIFVTFNSQEKQWVYSHTESVSLIDKRTALRKARSMAKLGFLHPTTKDRIGAGCAVIEDPEIDANIPNNLKQAWHKL